MSPLPTDREVCPRCLGVGTVEKTKAVKPWGTWEQRAELAKTAKAGDRWIQIKSGRVAIVVEPIDTHRCLGLKHENGRTTRKWISYFGSDYTPETPPHG